jgi:hypothetical protein
MRTLECMASEVCPSERNNPEVGTSYKGEKDNVNAGKLFYI